MIFRFPHTRFRHIGRAAPSLLTSVAMATAGFPAAPANAQDASFGCYVLLCAAAVNPGWSGIPACVPKMEKLFDMLDKGAAWPTCPEGGEVSGLDFQPYLPCPDDTIAGTMVDNGRNGEKGWQAGPNGNLCGKVTSSTVIDRNGGGPTQTVLTMARPTRPDPDNVVISRPGQPAFTFWFALHRS
jgi:hypothetical protein